MQGVGILLALRSMGSVGTDFITELIRFVPKAYHLRTLYAC